MKIKKNYSDDFPGCSHITYLKARLHRRFLSRNSMQFVAMKLHQVSNMFETLCNFSATKIALSCATKIACVNGPCNFGATKIALSCATKIACVNGPLRERFFCLQMVLCYKTQHIKYKICMKKRINQNVEYTSVRT